MTAFCFMGKQYRGHKYTQKKRLSGRRRISCISFNPVGAWLQRNLPPQITSFYSIIIVKQLFFFVKNFLVSQIVIQSSFTNFPAGDH